MGETNDLQRMRGLIDKLNEASRRYYDQNESDISDDEWDAMYAELRKLEEKTGERMADSPTRRVGGASCGSSRAVDGTDVPLRADSICVHGDGEKALLFVQKIRAALEAKGVALKAL